MYRLTDDPVAELHRKDPPAQDDPLASGKQVSSCHGAVSSAVVSPQETALLHGVRAPGLQQADTALQLAVASKSLVQACRQQSAKDLDTAEWGSESTMERDQENCSCLHALMQQVYTGRQQSYSTESCVSHVQCTFCMK